MLFSHRASFFCGKTLLFCIETANLVLNEKLHFKRKKGFYFQRTRVTLKESYVRIKNVQIWFPTFFSSAQTLVFTFQYQGRSQDFPLGRGGGGGTKVIVFIEKNVRF